MSNEQLAILAKQGDKNAMFDLWEQTRLLIYKLMMRYFPICPRFGMEPDDLKQCGYFALDRAVKAYKPDAGAVFTSYIGYHVQNVVQEAFGRRGKKDAPPLIVSIDEPLPGAEDITFADTIPDPDAAAEFERTIDDVQREQLHAAMEECLSELKQERERVIRARYHEGRTLKQIAEEQSHTPEHCRQQINRALRDLRHPRHAGRLRPFYDALDFIQSRAHTSVGFMAFRNRGASQPEWLVEMLEKYNTQEAT